MKPEMSIILPCYNVSRWLDKCIKSIFANDFTDYEVICINDASTDDTLLHLRQLAKSDSRMKIIDLKKNGGLANGRRVGIEAAQGNYIAFIDPDDLVERDYLSTLHKYVVADPEIDLVSMTHCYKEYKFLPKIVSGTVAEFVKDLYGKPIELTPTHRLMDTFFGRTVWSISAWCKLYRAEVLKNLPVINVFYQEDLLLNLYASPRIKRMVLIDDVKYHYRSGGGSATNPRILQDFVEVIQLKKQWAEDNLPDYERHYPWICFELKNIIYGYLSRAITSGKRTEEIKAVYDSVINQSHLDFLATTKDSAPDSYASEDFQAILSGDFARILARAKSRVPRSQKFMDAVKRLLSY